jgi:hypothetical protein
MLAMTLSMPLSENPALFPNRDYRSIDSPSGNPELFRPSFRPPTIFIMPQVLLAVAGD